MATGKNQDAKIVYDPQLSAAGNAVGESAARMNQHEVCKPHYRDSAGIVVAGAVNKYQVHRIGVLENDVGGEARAIAFATAPGFNLDYTEHRDRSHHASRVAAAVTEPPPPVAMSAFSSQ